MPFLMDSPFSTQSSWASRVVALEMDIKVVFNIKKKYIEAKGDVIVILSKIA